MPQHQGLQQQQQQAQVQIASSAQVLLSSLVEMPLADFEERLQNELMDNEALEIQEHEDADTDSAWGESEGDDPTPSDALSDALSDYRTMDDVPEPLRDAYNRRGDEERGERQISDEETSYDDLYRQIGELPLDEREAEIMRYLVGSLDESGFLAKDDATLCDELAFQEYLDTTPEEVGRLADLFRRFEPQGIGARNLRDCLLRQLPPSGRAHQVVEERFDDLMNARWHRVQEQYGWDDATLAEVRHQISRLNPRPGSLLAENARSTAPSVLPDFRVELDSEGDPIVRQIRGQIPELQVSPAFVETIVMHRAAQERAASEGEAPALSRAQEEAFVYARRKVEAAQAFIESCRRRHYTLQHVMEAIVTLQRDFFTTDDDESLLRPMVLKDVAERAGVDISTVSRAVNSKYVETDFGVYPLRHFFSTQFTSATGETVAARQVKAAIAELIGAEDRRNPFSDETLVTLLAERGMTVARRTVTKYRENLGIPKARLRR